MAQWYRIGFIITRSVVRVTTLPFLHKVLATLNLQLHGLFLEAIIEQTKSNLASLATQIPSFDTCTMHAANLRWTKVRWVLGQYGDKILYPNKHSSEHASSHAEDLRDDPNGCNHRPKPLVLLDLLRGFRPMSDGSMSLTAAALMATPTAWGSCPSSAVSPLTSWNSGRCILLSSASSVGIWNFMSNPFYSDCSVVFR